jgi:hypothetical protein
MDVAVGVDNAMLGVAPFGFGLALVFEPDDSDAAFGDEGHPFNVVDFRHRMRDFAAFGDELPAFVGDDRDVFLRSNIACLGDEFLHRVAATNKRSAAFMKKSHDIAASVAAIKNDIFLFH